jgi:sirohydrochlorin cobaltochelatase
MPSWRLYLRVFFSTLILVLPAAALNAETLGGILLLAHGAHIEHGQAPQSPANVWNTNVERLAHRLDRRHPTEVAFGMADPESIQAAVDRLERRGIEDIAVVPLFVSSHSPIIGNFRYILGLAPELANTSRLRALDRISSKARLRFGTAMDDNPLISGILCERALAVAGDPSSTDVILIAHGPSDEQENRLWLKDMERHAQYLRERGGFRRVTPLTHRTDAAAPVKAEARMSLRRSVAKAGQTGTAVVVPLLLSAGGIEAEIKTDLKGLPYLFAEPLMPHPNIERWIEDTARELLAAKAFEFGR